MSPLYSKQNLLAGLLLITGVLFMAFRLTPEAPTFRILILGDTVFGNNYPGELEELGLNYSIDEKGWDHHFEKLAPLMKSADEVILNLKGPLTNAEVSPYEHIKTHIYRNPPAETMLNLKKYGVTAVGLANNHTLDYGEGPLQETLDLLDEGGIAYFGAGENRTKAGLPFRKRLQKESKFFDFNMISGFWYRKRYSQVYHWYAGKTRPGVNKWNRDIIPHQIRYQRKRHPNEFLLSFPGYGKNYGWLSSYQQEISREMITAGADLVIGHGAQKVQELEYFQGKWIVYNLGNFIFVSPGYYEKEQAIPFSLMALMEGIPGEGSGWALSLRLYPIHTNNMENGFQARHATKKEAKQVLDLLISRSEQAPELKKRISLEKDDFGPNFLIQLGTWTSGTGFNPAP